MDNILTSPHILKYSLIAARSSSPLLLALSPFRILSTYSLFPPIFHGLDAEIVNPHVNDLTEPQSLDAQEPPAPPQRHNMFSGVQLLLEKAGVKRQHLIAGAAVAAAAASVGAFFLHEFLFDSQNLISLGYFGVFIFTFLGAATIFLPSASSLVVIGAGAWLNPFLVGIVAGTAASLGEFTGYAIGYEGGELLERRSRVFQRAKGWMEKRGSITLFLLSILPNPFFDAAGLAAGRQQVPHQEVLRHRMGGQDHPGNRRRISGGAYVGLAFRDNRPGIVLTRTDSLGYSDTMSPAFSVKLLP